MSWVDDFVSHTADTTSPELFRKWAAIWAVASALERKVWLRSKQGPIYPNLYVILCGPPGVGKTEVIWRIRDYLEKIKGVRVAPSSITRASLIDELNEAKREVVRPNETPAVVTFNSLQICVNELGVLLPSYDTDFMSVLTDLYDGKGYGEKRRTKNLEIIIPRPQINFISGTTPGQLNGMLPEGAWDQGFLSRTFIIYSGDRQLKEMFDILGEETGEHEALGKDLKTLSETYGPLTWEDEARELFHTWYLGGGPPIPDHPKLISYCARRGVHLAKLCMIAAVELDNSRTIGVHHFYRACDWLFEAETAMPDAFKALASRGAARNIDEVWHFAFRLYAKEQKPIMEHRLIQFLQEIVPAYEINTIIDSMVQSKLLKKQLVKGGTAYVPGVKRGGQ